MEDESLSCININEINNNDKLKEQTGGFSRKNRNY